jgi:CcmD family protein
MMKIFKPLFYLLIFLLLPMLVFSQNPGESKVGKFMRSEERSYVVIAVMVVILLGIFFYLFRMERRIKKLERDH